MRVSPTLRHGFARVGKKTREYRVWVGLRSRCISKTNPSYKYYGGRGISVCKSWLNSFESFFEDMGRCPSSKHSIDRIDVNGNYEPTNCRWATLKQQANNMSSNIVLKFQGQSKNISEWAEAIGLKYSTVYNRYRKYVQGLISIESVLNPERILVRGVRKPRPVKGPRKKGWKCNLTDEERLRRSRQLLSIIQKRKKLKDLTDGRS